jgi:hypothetical protein
MDPISLLVTALAAGAAKIGGDAAADAYATLLRAVRRWFADDQNGRWLVDKHAEEAAEAGDAKTPGVWNKRCASTCRRRAPAMTPRSATPPPRCWKHPAEILDSSASFSASLAR